MRWKIANMVGGIFLTGNLVTDIEMSADSRD